MCICKYEQIQNSDFNMLGKRIFIVSVSEILLVYIHFLLTDMSGL